MGDLGGKRLVRPGQAGGGGVEPEDGVGMVGTLQLWNPQQEHGIQATKQRGRERLGVRREDSGGAAGISTQFWG